MALSTGGRGAEPIVALAPATVTATSTSSTVLDANPNRTRVVITNTGGEAVCLAIGSHAAVFDAGVYLKKEDGRWESEGSLEAIQAITESGPTTLAIQEYE